MEVVRYQVTTAWHLRGTGKKFQKKKEKMHSTTKYLTKPTWINQKEIMYKKRDHLTGWLQKEEAPIHCCWGGSQWILGEVWGLRFPGRVEEGAEKRTGRGQRLSVGRSSWSLKYNDRAEIPPLTNGKVVVDWFSFKSTDRLFLEIIWGSHWYSWQWHSNSCWFSKYRPL